MEYIKWFKDLDENSLGVAGGKGNNLGIMAKIGLPVPAGFVITAQTYEEFINTTRIKDRIFSFLKGLDPEDTEKLQQAAKQIQTLVIDTQVPENIKEVILESYAALSVEKGEAEDLIESKESFVAVRSSATAEDLPEASFAGQQATYLNVRGQDDIIKAVRACWASLFTARAIYYRERNNFPHDQVLIAVVIQKMVNSEKSGVMFTINPTNNQPDEIIIEAVYGLGEMIVSGEVSPDLYIVIKKIAASRRLKLRKKTKACSVM